MPHKLFVGQNISTVKLHNLQTLLKVLLRHEYISRVELARMTGLSNTTITNLVTELLEQGVVAAEGTEQLRQRTGAGRPRTALRLVPEARYAVGVHIGVGLIRVAITDLRANVLSVESFTHPLDNSAADVLAHIVDNVRRQIKRHGLPPAKIIGVGVGASGLVDPETGVNVMAPNLGWNNLPIQQILTTELNLPVVVDNNVRAMALGESLFGLAQNVKVMAFVYARQGVGAGFVVDGQLFRGKAAGAGEIGHTTITLEGGRLCRCGNRGCLETLVSETAIIAEAARLGPHHSGLPKLSLDQVFATARGGDLAMQAMLKERARYMGIALANLVNILNPELILLGGIFYQGRDLLLPTVEKTIQQRSFGNLGQQVNVQPTGFGQQAGVIGAVALALTNFFYQPDPSQNFTLTVGMN